MQASVVNRIFRRADADQRLRFLLFFCGSSLVICNEDRALRRVRTAPRSRDELNLDYTLE